MVLMMGGKWHLQRGGDVREGDIASCIYILTTDSFALPYVKIGETSNLPGRLRVLNSSVPSKYKVFATIASPFPVEKNSHGIASSIHTKMLEKVFHVRYAHRRAPNGEFFQVSPDAVIDEFEDDVRFLYSLHSSDKKKAEEYLNLMLNMAQMKSDLFLNDESASYMLEESYHVTIERSTRSRTVTRTATEEHPCDPECSL